MECNRNRVSTRDISCSCRVQMPFCGLIPPQASCDLFFLDLKQGARALFVLHLKSVKSVIVVRPICSSLISLKSGARALFLLGAGFYLNKIIIFVVSRSWRFYHCVYVRKEKLLIFRRACVQHFYSNCQSSGASVCLWNIGTVLPRCSQWNKSTAL